MSSTRDACNVTLTSEEASFTEEGYKKVAVECKIHSDSQVEASSQPPFTAEQHVSVSECDKIMTVYIERFAQKIHCSVLDPLELQGFVIWYSGHRAVQSLAKLCDELHTLRWTSCGFDQLSPLQQNIVQLRASANTYAVGFMKSVPPTLLESAGSSEQWRLLAAAAALVVPVLTVCICLKGCGFYARLRILFSPGKQRRRDISVMDTRRVNEFSAHNVASVATCAAGRCCSEDYVELT